MAMEPTCRQSGAVRCAELKNPTEFVAGTSYAWAFYVGLFTLCRTILTDFVYTNAVSSGTAAARCLRPLYAASCCATVAWYSLITRLRVLVCTAGGLLSLVH